MLYANTVLDGVYQIVREIGRGGAGIVYLAYHTRLQKYVVLKNARINRTDMDYLRNEVDILKGLHHKSLPQVYDFLTIGNEIYTVIDYVDGQDLDKAVLSGEHFTEEQIVGFMLELSEVLEYLHSQARPVIHCDIKPENVMRREDGSLCLIDFNISIWAGRPESLYGYSQYYLSPEQSQLANELRQKTEITASIDGRSDIYSLGATMYYVLTGFRPGENGVFFPLSDLGPECSKDLVRVIETCMEQDPDRRYQTADELSRALRKLITRGADFRKRVITQAAILCVCGLIFAGGALSLFYGLREKRHQEFLGAFRQVQTMASSGDSDSVVRYGVEVLNDYSDQKEQSPESWYLLLNTVGDSYQELSRNSKSPAEQTVQRNQAVAYYSNALEFGVLHQVSEASLSDGVIDWACALFLVGDMETLKEPAPWEGKMMSQLQSLLHAVKQAIQGDDNALMLLTEQETESRSGVSTVYAAYLALATVQENRGDDRAAAESLERALEIQSSDQLTLRLAKTYMKIGMESDSEEDFRNAATWYEKLLRGGSSVFQARLGYAAALRACGELKRAEGVIDGLLKEYPDHYDVLAQAALIASQSGDKTAAKDYATKAMQKAPDQSGSSMWDLLKQIEGG